MCVVSVVCYVMASVVRVLLRPFGVFLGVVVGGFKIRR